MSLKRTSIALVKERRPKRAVSILLAVLIALGLSACDSEEAAELQGVTVTDSGNVAVTFRVPDDKTIEDVLGCEVSEKHSMSIAHVGTTDSAGNSGIMDWYYVAKGGIVTCRNEIYRYGPTATASSQSAPSAYVTLATIPEESDILKQEDAGVLAERYGIDLYFEGEPADSDTQTARASYSASDATFNEVYRFSPGFSDGAMRTFATVEGSDASVFILHSDGTMFEAPCSQFSNFAKGSALAVMGMKNEGYADAIIDKQGNVVWSIADDGEEAAQELFGDVEVTGIRSPFSCEYDMSDGIGGTKGDTYRGYFPVLFDVDSFDMTGSCLGVLDSDGNWVVEPAKRIGYLRGYDSCICFEYDERQQGSGYGWVFDCREGKLYECSTKEEYSARAEQIRFDDYLSAHDGLVYGSNDVTPDDFDTSVDGFYNEAGELIVDLSNYSFTAASDNPEFSGGYALLEIRNAQMSKYLVAIDLSGEETMAPIKNNGHGKMSEGAFFVEDGENGYFLDAEGNKIGEVAGSKSIPFSEGFAWIDTDDGWKCIDKKGVVQFC